MTTAAALPPGRRGGPTGALFSARVVYAFSWYNVGAVLPLIGTAFAAGPEALGIILAAFLVGAGLFQVPAGIAAVRWGSRPVSLVGLAVMGVAATASGLAPSWPLLALARFAAGVGAAFFFSPALSLIASYYPAGERGVVIGLYNGGFSVGAALGLALGAFVGERWGWSLALSGGGVALLVAAVGCWALLPLEPGERAVRTLAGVWRQTRTVLGSRSVWALSLGLTGFWAAIYVVAQYFVEFAGSADPSWGLTLAAGLVTLVIVVSFPAGPLGGWLAERSRRRVGLLVAVGIATGVLVALVPFLSLPELIADFVGVGLLDGVGFAVLYLIPTYLPETSANGLALGVAVINSIQVGLGSGIAAGFGFLVAAFGYPAAWVLAGVIALGFLPLLAWVSPVASRPALIAREDVPPAR